MMQSLATGASFLAVVLLGITAGALLAEASVLVPFWRSQPPRSFLDWYREHAALLLWFFGPLEVATTVVVIIAALLAWSSGAGGAYLSIAAALLALAVLASFPLYFQRANASFEAGTIAIERVAPELRRWALWHWARTLIATASFILATLALE
ncbi:MAG: DUF1772 domain-containing protein [Deltaproteobacteria bacterium]|nr:DUF1772 domain-containing protein [Deltaproteobacteria bacterium]